MGFDPPPALRPAVAAVTAMGSGAAMLAFAGAGMWAGVVLCALLGMVAAVEIGEPRDAPPMSPRLSDPAGDGDGAMLRVLLDHAPNALLSIDADCTVRALNRAARRLFAADDRIVAPPPALFDPAVERVWAGDRDWRLERARLDDAARSVTLVALVDVGAAERVAEARAARELMLVLGHEVMNAMAPISSLAETALASASGNGGGDLSRHLRTLAERADGLRRFNAAYRQIARMPEPERRPTPIAAVCDDVAILFEAEWGDAATLSIELAGDGSVALDRQQVTHALLALARNGVEAARQARRRPVVTLAAEASGSLASFRVSDNGPGVPPGDREDIFRPFFTTKPDGNGIGLATTRQIARSHGGDLILLDDASASFEMVLPDAAAVSGVGPER